MRDRPSPVFEAGSRWTGQQVVQAVRIRLGDERAAPQPDPLGRAQIGYVHGLGSVEVWDRARGVWKAKLDAIAECALAVIVHNDQVVGVATIETITPFGDRVAIDGRFMSDHPLVGQQDPLHNTSRNPITYGAITTVLPTSRPPRPYESVLRDAVSVLTEAARLQHPVSTRPEIATSEPRDSRTHSPRTEPIDWAEFVTLAIAGAAANIGGVEKAFRGRPGSWEAESIRSMLRSTIGDDPDLLDKHRTEPLQILLRPAELLLDIGYHDVYRESQRVLQDQQGRHVWSYRLTDDRRWHPLDDAAPPFNVEVEVDDQPGTVVNVPRSEQDEHENDKLRDLEVKVEDLEYEGDPRAYGAALQSALRDRARERGVDVEITIDTEVRSFVVDEDGFYGIGEQLVEEVVERTPLPWSGVRPGDYPSSPAEVVELERLAGRLPHDRALRTL